ncbi:MAG: DUF512 domain-containing protein [Spirochaetes bacterium]|nr:DUF512 domain-containing protein [Spirochaetota bacterium]
MQARIHKIRLNSVAYRLGLKSGDTIVQMNGHAIRDSIDFMYYSADDSFDISVMRGGRTIERSADVKPGERIGIEIEPFRTRSCRNKCVFCFVDQMPDGMRKTLYLKDDDYRMSFLYGNYITLTNLSDADRARIVEQRLSPLYVSVHATDRTVRNFMLGTPGAPSVSAALKYYARRGIVMHTQIVLCPGMNDGAVLRKTVNDLLRLYPSVASIAVVPVGLTRYMHRAVDAKHELRLHTKAEARAVIAAMKPLQERCAERYGESVIYIADELYIKAGLPIPGAASYADFPQIENGVGMIASFLRDAKRVTLPKKIKPRKIAIITGVSFAPFLRRFARRLTAVKGLSLEVITAQNTFFGNSVTVAGLLTGSDVINAVAGKTNADVILVPDVSLKFETNRFLDHMSLRDVSRRIGIPVRVVAAGAQGLVDGIVRENH